MADVWIRDDVGRVLGPIGVAVLRDLISAGRLSRIQAASYDGQRFVAVADVPEVADLVAREARKHDDRSEAERIGGVLHVLKSKQPHEIFELPANATLDQFKSAFFRLAKHYHPDRLPADSLPELRLAYDSLFHFLAQTMAAVERQLSAAPASPPPAAAPAPATPAAPKSNARYEAGSFVGLVDRPDGAVEMEVKVSPANVSIFTENGLVNLSKDGVFLPLKQGLPLGTMLELRFLVESRTIPARCRVVFENFGGQRGKAGLGLKFVRLADADRAYLVDYVKRIQAEQPAKSR